MTLVHSGQEASVPTELEARLAAYRPTNEWGDPVHHMICDEAANALADLRDQLSAALALVDQRGDALVMASVAINAAFAQAQAEYQNHDLTASKHDKTVRQGRAAIRAALEAGHSTRTTTASAVGTDGAAGSEPK